MTKPAIRFPNSQSKEFFSDLKAEVNRYFEQNKLSVHANSAMITKTITLFAMYLGAYALLFVPGMPLWGMLLCAIVMGVGTAGIGFSIAHDAIHGAYSANPRVNHLLGLSMNLIGGSAYVWKITHNMVHHTYTNIHEVDEDLDVTALMRLSPEQPRKGIHRFQHIYFPIVYSLAVIFWVFAKDYKKLSQKQIGPITRKHSRKDVLETLATKLLYYTYVIAIPLLVLPITPVQFIIGFLAMQMTAGIILGIVFQLAHVVEKTAHLQPDEKGSMENSWAVHQMLTTADFARDNALVNWYIGGLNFQVVHHLFPNICSIHYRKLSFIIQEVAARHQVPYNLYPSFRSAVASHVRTLYRFGHKDVAVVEERQAVAA